MYGDIPEVQESNNATVFYADEKQALKICEYFLPYIDKEINTDLSYGDVDYFNASQCLILLKILEKNKNYLLMKLGEKLYTVLKNSCQEAITRETGIVIEL